MTQNKKPRSIRTFTQVPNAIVQTHLLAHVDKIAWCVLYSHDFKDPKHGRKGWVRLSLDTIAEEACTSRKQVCRSLRKLTDLGLVSVERSQEFDRSNTYVIHDFTHSDAIRNEWETRERGRVEGQSKPSHKGSAVTGGSDGETLWGVMVEHYGGVTTRHSNKIQDKNKDSEIKMKGKDTPTPSERRAT